MSKFNIHTTHRRPIVPHPDAKEIRRLKMAVLRAKVSRPMTGIVTLGRLRAAVASQTRGVGQ
ncbi:MAG: hypothetical protein LCH62_20825 [Proteobacteria bacterium]|nr:hypothetical protein [Pseudomonadota bacterium]